MSSNLKEEALEKLQAGDVYSVVEFLDGQEDAVAALKTYNELQRHLYWEEKNLGLSLAEGYLLVVDLVQKPADEQANKRFSEVKAALAPLEDGEFFVEQLDTALGVFQGGK